MKALRKLLYYRRLFGVRGALDWTFLKLARGKSRLFSFRDPHTGFRITIRLGATDAAAYEQVIVNAEYAAALAPPPEYIVDCGANIGLATLYFSWRYPDAKIIAVEPDSSNFEMLVRNVAALENVSVVRAAVWNEATSVALDDSCGGEWGRRVRAGARRGDEVSTVTIPDLMAKFGFPRIDLLKVDIEGAELELFSGDVAWASKVNAIVIELHDRFREGCAAAFEAASAGFPYRWRVGENRFVSRRPPVFSDPREAAATAPVPKPGGAPSFS